MSTDISFAKLSIEARTEVIKEAMESTLWSLEKSEKEIEFLRARLQEQKEALGHGRWLAWIRETFGDDNATIRKIQRFIQKPNATLLTYLDGSESSGNSGELVPRESRKPGRVKVVEPPADHSVDVNEKVDDGTDDDPTPDPPTQRKTAAGSRKVPESEKPKTRALQPELLPDEPEDGAVILRESDTDGIKELYNRVIDPDTQIHNVCNRFAPVEIFDLMVSITTDENKKRIAKLMRKAADELDPPDTSKSKIPSAATLKGTVPTCDNYDVTEAIESWIEYKQSHSRKEWRYQTVASWLKDLKRIENAIKKRSEQRVVEMLTQAESTGWRHWDHDTEKDNPFGGSGRINGNGKHEGPVKHRDENGNEYTINRNGKKVFCNGVDF